MSKGPPKDKRETTEQEFAETTNNILDAIRDTYVGKASVAVAGLCLKVAVVSTITGNRIQAQSLELPEHTRSMHGSFVRFLPSFAAYIVLVLFTLSLRLMANWKLASGGMSRTRKRSIETGVAGLNLIPAWAFKDCVVVIIAGKSPMQAAVAVLLGATVFALFVMPKYKSENLDWPGKVLYDLRVTLASCMGLGVGFAMNAFPQYACMSLGWDFENMWLMIVYPVVMTTLVVLMQEGLSELPGSDTEQSPFFKTFVSFTKTTGNFWTAWAWHTLLHRLGMGLITPSMSCWSTALMLAGWALFVLLIGSMMVMPMEWKSKALFTSNTMMRDFEKLVELVAGMLVAFAFLDCVFAIYKCLHFHGYPILGAWVFAVVVVAVMAVSAAAVAVFVEWTKKEETRLLAEREPWTPPL